MWSSDAEILEALAFMEEAFKPMAPQNPPVPEKTIRKRKKQRSPPDPEVPSFRLLGPDDDFLDSSEPITSSPDPDSQPPLNNQETSPSLIVLTDSPVLATDKKPPVTKLDDLPRKRTVVATEVYRSAYLQRDISILGDLNKSEKQILHFVLVDSYHDREIVFKAQIQSLTRSNLKSLVEGDRVSTNVVHAWCGILNTNERFKSRDSPSRIFVSFSMTNIFASVAPTSGQPFLFCFNLGNSKLQVIHPRKARSILYSNHIQPAKDLLIRLLQDNLPVVNSISWMTPEVFIPDSNLDCHQTDNALHLLRIMETYKGSKKRYSTGITNETQLKRFALRVCHT
ncbi:hypothetical protein RND81_06G024800 [Saponaria officinalis]|uniref:Uncharacterized protein n=1 Tax=Saponaria officinalis TaxID=3572 RepID=A0AAW1K6A7_SAPOF